MTSGVMTLVASKRPPRPDFDHADRHLGSRRKISKAIAVVTSKNVGSRLERAVLAQPIDDGEHVGGDRVEDVAASTGNAVDGDALFDAIEMRRGVAARAVAGGAQAALDHRRDRSLAVGAGDVDRRPRALGPVQRVENLVDVLEAELDAELFEREEPLTRGHDAAS